MSPGGGLTRVLVLIGMLVAGALVARRRLDVVEVRGRSMAPTLVPGDRLLVMRLRRPPRAGEIVLAPDPREPGRELIKRVTEVGPSGVVLRGDNPASSTDERAFGPLDAASVRWRAVLRYWPPRPAADGSSGQTFRLDRYFSSILTSGRPRRHETDISVEGWHELRAGPPSRRA